MVNKKHNNNNNQENENDSRKKQKLDNNNNNNNNNNNGEQQQPQPQQQHNNKLTLSEVLSDEITKLSKQHWLKEVNTKTFDIKLVETIYRDEMLKSEQRVQLLELSHYLENYLWPNFNESTLNNKYHLMSIIIMVNEKSKEGLNSFQVFHNKQNSSETTTAEDNNNNNNSNNNTTLTFKNLFENLLQIELSELTMVEQCHFIKFFINAFQNVEDILVRNECLKIVSYPIWLNLSQGRYQQEIQSLSEPLEKKLRLFKKKIEKLTNKNNSKSIEIKYSNFLLELMKQFIKTLDSLVLLKSSNLSQFKESLNFCERFLEFLIDLMTQITTRRFFYALFDDFHFILKVSQSEFMQSSNNDNDSKVLSGLLGILKVYYNFSIDNFTGEELTKEQATGIHYLEIQEFQKVVFKHFPEIKEIALRNVSFVESKSELLNIISTMSQERLNELCYELNLISKDSNENKKFLISLLISKYQKKETVIEQSINRVSLYPTEKLLWDDSAIPNSNYNNEKSLALPKLNLQFLSFNDYLMRNFVLTRLESAYEIKEDIQDTVKRLSPKLDNNGIKTIFGGWSRMSLPLLSPFKITSVQPSLIGEIKPNKVYGIVNVSTSNCKPHIKEEWDSIKEHDILFLITIQVDKSNSNSNSNNNDISSLVKYVRGCEVIEVVNNNNNNNDNNNKNNYNNNRNNNSNSNNRSFKVSLDTNQYQEDLESSSLKLYDTFNIVLRRNPKENNFKAVLDTIISLFNVKNYLPDWLSSVFLGYPSNNSSSSNEDGDQQQENNNNNTILFNDTFLNLNHIEQVYKDKTIELSDNLKNNNNNNNNSNNNNFKIKFNNENNSILVDIYETSNKNSIIINNGIGSGDASQQQQQQQQKRNKIEFTSTQIEAITSGMKKENLTLIVGPPGTGKTDIAVQIISNLYHSSPNERTLIITHSNQALNQLFEKIYNLDINERYLLRLGHGQKQLNTSSSGSSSSTGNQDFSKTGRIDFWLNLRLNRLNRVDQLAKSLSINDDVSYTCDTALHFFSYHVLSRFEKFEYDLSKVITTTTTTTDSQDDISKVIDFINENYPFKKFFIDNKLVKQETEQGLLFSKTSKFNIQDIKLNLKELWSFIQLIFKELEECKVFELLKSPNDRYNYLLLKQSKIVAMTCTHAALKRNELINLGFKFDNLLMEESAQISDIESFIPLQLQSNNINEIGSGAGSGGNNSSGAGSGGNNSSGLKRIILIGDHNQLPPVVKNQSLAKYSHFDQSLFTRLIRLEIPHIILDRQGRSRSSISELFRWRYKGLQDLPLISQEKRFQLANPGLAYDYQLINVDESDGYGVGESEPMPHFYQNLGEAEYIVAMYQYLIAIGYPSEKITVLTTYNGQKHLLRDVFKAKCLPSSSNNKVNYGLPLKITTIDKYQGQQNDIVLLSLVRTKQYGHIRDVRRLIVAMSRARFGLYIFCKKQFFQNCYETSLVFSKLLKRPDKLIIMKSEQYGNNDFNRLITSKIENDEDSFEIQNSFHMKSLVESNEQQQ